jgi:hypothetical protein
MTYKDRLTLYERMKQEIRRTAKTHDEYERRIRALAKKLNV